VCELVCCVDFGSTWTKAALVDVDAGRLLASASHPTTLASDVLDGWRACRDRLSEVDAAAARAPVRACSSAGGGLRIAVVGNEELVTAEAGRRVALSSGGRVVHVASGGLRRGADQLVASRPDVVLLVGGTDGGNAEALLGGAEVLASIRWSAPVVVAGNAEVAGQAAATLAAAGTPFVLADNVVPRIGVLRPEPARAAIREMFVRHVIGGKHLSASSDFLGMVRGATPDVVLSAVELLSAGYADQAGVGDVAVVDVGGATTDVHSVVELDPADAGLARQVVAPVAASRTVEGDLGVRSSAVSAVAAGRESGLLDEAEATRLAAAAKRRRADPAIVASSESGEAVDRRLATVAVTIALRRHAGRRQVRFGAGQGRQLEHTGKDLSDVALLVGSGGVLRHSGPKIGAEVLALACKSDADAGWLTPRQPTLVVDRDYVLAPAGLLAEDHPQAACALLRRLHVEECSP
jgi:uncharacterized protein (TIGR01319 family)